MKIIDAHNHLFGKPLFNPEDYIKHLINTMDKIGVSKTCLSGLGPSFSCGTNEDVKKAIKNYPDRILGACYIRPGVDSEDKIDEAYSDGFKMIKITLPTSGYDDPSFYPLWQRALDYNFPILFHTGVVTTFTRDPKDRINSWFMHPMRIEPICNAFPKLNIIVAHLGVHWNDDAAEIVRMKPNAYVDLTGEPTGWRLRADRIGFDHWLWWKDAFKKVIFGTDVLHNKMKTILEEDIKRYEQMRLDDETKELIFHKNFENLIKYVGR